MRMTQKRKTIMAAIDRFDEGAQRHGWEQDQGSGGAVEAAAKIEYEESRAALIALVVGK